MIGEIITEHRERMLNLKKYYPFSSLLILHFPSLRRADMKHLIWDIS